MIKSLKKRKLKKKHHKTTFLVCVKHLPIVSRQPFSYNISIVNVDRVPVRGRPGRDSARHGLQAQQGGADGHSGRDRRGRLRRDRVRGVLPALRQGEELKKLRYRGMLQSFPESFFSCYYIYT